MKKSILQLILLLSLVCLCIGGYYWGKHLLHLPFRAANDALHQKDALFTLDFLIPGGEYIDEKARIADVIEMKFKKTSSPFEKILRTASEQIPPGYRYLGDALLFFFWTLCFLTFLRVFTFTGYARALRISLLMGGIVYYFMPDLSPGRIDDMVCLFVPVLIIAARIYLVRKKRGEKKIFAKERS